MYYSTSTLFRGSSVNIVLLYIIIPDYNSDCYDIILPHF